MNIYWQGVREKWHEYRTFLAGIVKYAFVVYPRGPEEIGNYVSQEERTALPVVGVVGRITPGSRSPAGIVLGIPQQIESLEQRSTEDLHMLLSEIEGYIDVPYFGLAGRLPALFSRRGIPLGEKFVTGEFGTYWAIEDCVIEALRVRGISYGEKVGVLGFGRIGRMFLANFIQHGFGNVVGLDQGLRRPRVWRGITVTNELEAVRNCKLLVVVTAQGKDLEPFIPFMRQDIVVLDDTYPEIPAEMLGRIPGEVYKIALGLEGVRFDPPLPGFQPDWIPGCVAEAIVRTMGFQPTTQTEFNRVAREIALRALLTPVR